MKNITPIHKNQYTRQRNEFSSIPKFKRFIKNPNKRIMIIKSKQKTHKKTYKKMINLKKNLKLEVITIV